MIFKEAEYTPWPCRSMEVSQNFAHKHNFGNRKKEKSKLFILLVSLSESQVTTLTE